ncbi:MAG: hypothetical protein GC185_09820 [Alphaproteobacteria bacterium]|nr:hypothetical protein [Alphaproteobacteria bacterium]
MPKNSPVKTVVSFLRGIFGGKKPAKASPPAPSSTSGPVKVGTASPAARPLTQDQQKELDALCQKLLKKHDLISSGRLQMLGLKKIKNRMGKHWWSLQEAVYGTVEEVIRENIKKGDLYIRYGEETYVLIFADADRTESDLRAKLIADEVRKRLLALKRPELAELTVRGDASSLREDEIEDKDMHAVAGMMAEPTAAQLAEPPEKPARKAENGGEGESEGESETGEGGGKKKSGAHLSFESPTTVKTVMVEAGPLSNVSAARQAPSEFTFVPLWDVKRKALTTYLCMPAPRGEGALSPLDWYGEMSECRPYSARVELDLLMLEAVSKTMRRMAEAERKLIVVCPVHYDTLYRQESMDRFIRAAQSIPKSLQKCLEILLTGLPAELPAKDAFWFVPLLKSNLCRSVFAEVALESAQDMAAFAGSNLDALGVCLPASPAEATLMPHINAFKDRIAPGGVPRAFVLNLPSLSLVTTAVCAGFDYLGGSAVHAGVPEPSHMYRYQHEDLLSSLLSAEL